MKPLIHMTALAASSFAGAAAATERDAFVPGLQPLQIAHETRPLDGVLWYPAAANAPVQQVHNNAVWEGVMAAPEAPARDGQFPLVVLSHGMYGNMMNQSWLAAALARRGYMVAAISHPGTSTWARNPDDARQLWERPRDISRVIDHLINASDAANRIDAERIYMAGHSLGGWTAAMLAGAQFSPETWSTFCASGADPLVCGIMDRWGVAQSAEDRQMIAKNYGDDRISAFALFDLGGTQTFSAESLGAVTAPMLVIGAPEMDSGLNLDLESRALVQGLSSADVTYLEPSGLAHYDFLGLCTPRGLAILKAEEPEDAFICETTAEARGQKHDMVIDAVLTHFAD